MGTSGVFLWQLVLYLLLAVLDIIGPAKSIWSSSFASRSYGKVPVSDFVYTYFEFLPDSTQFLVLRLCN